MTTATLTIGGSSAAAATGLDPFRSRVQLWLELTGRVEPPDESEAMRWGTLLEPVIAAEVETRGYVTVPAPADEIVDGRMSAHLDGYVADANDGDHLGTQDYGPRGVLEIKTANAYRSREWGDEESPDVPIAYYVQTQHYLEVTRLDWALIACLLGGQKLILRPVTRDEKVGAALREQEAAFLDLVERDEAPAPDGSESADAMLRLLHPEHEPGRLVDLTATDYDLVREIQSRREAARQADRQLSELEQALKMRLGDGEAGVFQGRRVCTYRTAVAHRLDAERLRAELPEIAAEYVRESRYRTLRVSP